ncbi:MAG: hypothetical protein AAGG51_07945 [Cyanobacteria bacterium P01_G01_bin.54]
MIQTQQWYHWLLGIGWVASLGLQGWMNTDEATFRERQEQALQALAAKPPGSIAYEYEKNSYPRAIARFLQGDAAAIAFLEQPDPEAVQTQQVDLHSGFTLKVQMRKYFALPLTSQHRAQMRQAFAQVTRQDPLTVTANPPRKFWQNSQDDCTTLVDCRGTENLQTMVETSVYLMAEETGNEGVQALYAQKLRDRVERLTRYGFAEWNSPSYLGHTTAAWLNLYDYAQDPEIKALAQQALDRCFEMAALKYWRGTWGHPAKRYAGEGAARFFWLYFGEARLPAQPEPDWVHASLSTYRPQLRTLQIARRQFTKPWQVQRFHANYPRTQIGFQETIYFGSNYEIAFLDRQSGPDWTSFGLRWWDGQQIRQFYY